MPTSRTAESIKHIIIQRDEKQEARAATAKGMARTRGASRGYRELSLLRSPDFPEHGVEDHFGSDLRDLGGVDLAMGSLLEIPDNIKVDLAAFGPLSPFSSGASSPTNCDWNLDRGTVDGDRQHNGVDQEDFPMKIGYFPPRPPNHRPVNTNSMALHGTQVGVTAKCTKAGKSVYWGVRDW